MLNGCFPIFLRELLILRRRFWRILASMIVSPMLYLIVFNYAFSNNYLIEKQSDYLFFLVTGLVSMSSMVQAWSIASDINVARFYWHIFEEIQAAPISKTAYVLGEVLAGILKAYLSVLVIIMLGIGFGIILSLTFCFWLAIGINSFIFASLAVSIAMFVKSHADQTMLSNFIITPMSFLGSTIFPLEKLPVWAQKLTKLLPLTHATRIIRDAALGQVIDLTSYLFLISLGLFFFSLAIYSIELTRK